MRRSLSILTAGIATIAMSASAFAMMPASMRNDSSMHVKTRGTEMNMSQKEVVHSRIELCRVKRGIEKAACLMGANTKRSVKRMVIKKKLVCEGTVGIERVRCLFKARGGQLSSRSSSSMSASSVSSSASSAASSASSTSSASSAATSSASSTSSN